MAMLLPDKSGKEKQTVQFAHPVLLFPPKERNIAWCFVEINIQQERRASR